MSEILLPDGSKRSYDDPISVLDIAKDISAGLAASALAGKVGEKLVDLDFMVSEDSEVTIITDRNAEALDIIRHSTAHLLAQAVQELFPDVKVAIGPAIEDGFYYDFAKDTPFTAEDLTTIENKMHALVKQDIPVARSELSKKEAIDLFKGMGEKYKVELLEEMADDEVLSLYKQGKFADLCRGPHVNSTGKLGIFKLTKVAGAYWRGDSNNEMLQRIYGTAWLNKKDLTAYLQRLEEAEKRDHRRFIKTMHLCHLEENAPGMVFWHPRGWTIYEIIRQYVRKRLQDNGYLEISTPIIANRKLWERSGHWEMFADNMFTTKSENHEYAIKPMNCPCHVQVFKQGLKSYRDLPLRLAEFGCCHRNETSGALHGLMRVVGFVQDDAHIFCTEDQIQSEASIFIDLLLSIYKDFGFDDVLIKLATRPDKRVGSDDQWDAAEKALEEALLTSGLDWSFSPGEGAFYGPKLEFSLKDCLGRVWQCGTFQIDYAMPGRLGASYIDEHGAKAIPVMLHRAILGSFERFIGILLEHYAGKLPIWLAPCQVIVANITDNHAAYAKEIAESLRNSGFRVELDLRNEKIGYKIRGHSLQHVPYILIIGDKEVESKTVAVRNMAGKDLGAMALEQVVELMNKDVTRLGR